MNTIYFDMDGTIANLYGVDNWLSKLKAEDSSPYVEAEPLVDTSIAGVLLEMLQNSGIRIGIISWLAKDSSKEYNKEVRKAKKNWLVENFPEIDFDEVHIVKYGTRKDYVAKDKYGILFDDADEVRNKWRGISHNPNEEDIVEVLERIRSMTE